MNKSIQNRSILVTGSHRSGTTWLAKMLCLAQGTKFIDEPFNLNEGMYRLDGKARNWYTYPPDLGEKITSEAFAKVLSKRAKHYFPGGMKSLFRRDMRDQRLVVKDPIAAFASEWLADRFPMDVIVIVRHPAAFTASLKRLGWHFSFDQIIAQEKLLNEVLKPYKSEILANPKDIVTQGALIWKLVYYYLGESAKRHPAWLVRTHENLSLNPVDELREIYHAFSLNWSEKVENKIHEFTGKHNPANPNEGQVHTLKRNSAENVKRWKSQLTVDEIRLIRDITEEVSHLYYDDDSWL